MQTPYTARIKAMAPQYDPRHIEAFMRVEHPTLDGLPLDQFKREVRIASLCINEAGVAQSERIAASFGL